MARYDATTSQNELQNAGITAVQHFKHDIFTGMQSFFIAKVVKYDKKKHRADVQPLANMSSGQKSAQYLDLPVTEQCYLLDEAVDALKPDFRKQDKNNTIPAHDGVPAHESTDFVGHLPKKHFMRPGVVCVCAVLDRDNDSWDGTAKTYNPNSSRTHNANDSIVIGVLGEDWLN